MSLSRRMREIGFDPSPLRLRVLDRFQVATRAQGLIFTSGQLPITDGTEILGRVGAEVDMTRAREAARLCLINCLRAAAAVVDIDRIERPVKMLGMVNTAEGFTDTTEVINAASELLAELFGEAGLGHARSAVGVVTPGNWAVEIELVLAERD